MKNLPLWMITVTPFSKIIAAVIFVTLPLLTFFAGLSLGAAINPTSKIPTSQITVTSTVIPTIIAVTTSVPSTTYDGWKAYKSDSYKLSIKYPSTAKMTVTQNKCTFSECTGTYDSIKIDVSNNLILSLDGEMLPKDCSNCKTKEYSFSINDKNYTLMVGFLNDTPTLGSVLKQNITNKGSESGIAVGAGSKLNNMYATLYSNGKGTESDISTILNILKSITY